jgi:Zn-dependent peptidase ImmA (M78 family)
MPRVNVDISPFIIDWVMANVSTNSLELKLQDYLLKWRSGEKTPTFGQIERLSKATHIPLGYFFLNIPPQEDYSVLKFRTLNSEAKKPSSRELLDVIAQMEAIQSWMKDHLISEGKEKLSFVSSADINPDIQKTVLDIRETVGIDTDWYLQKIEPDNFKFLRNALSNIGVLIMASGVVGHNNYRPLDVEEFRAFTLIDDYAPLVFINANDSKGGKLFSLLHEVVHIWIGVDSLYNDRLYFTSSNDNTEQFCNAVAAELLVPNAIFCEKWANTNIRTNKRDVIKSLANIFKCSITVIARRALDNGFITGEQYAMIARKAITDFAEGKKKRDKDGGNFYATDAARMDHNFILALNGSIQEGKTLSTDAYRLTGTTRKTFPGLIEKIIGAQE